MSIRHTTAVDLLLVVRIHPTTSRRTCRRPAAKTPRFCMIIFEAGLCARAQNRAMQPSVINFLPSDHAESNSRMWILKRHIGQIESSAIRRLDEIHVPWWDPPRGACRHSMRPILFTWDCSPTEKYYIEQTSFNKCDVSKKEIWYPV